MAKKTKKVTQTEALTSFLTNLEKDEYTDAETVLAKVVKSRVRAGINKQKAKLFKPSSKQS